MSFIYKIYFLIEGRVRLELIASSWDEVTDRIGKHESRYEEVVVERIERFRVLHRKLEWPR